MQLHEALCKEGIAASMECSDGHKHVDICIHSAKLYIEVEGPAHFTNADQIERDFKRDNYSTEDGFETFRIPNNYIDEQLVKVVVALKEVVENRSLQNL